MGAPSTLFPITDDHAAAIGRVAVNWSLVEAQLAYLIVDLLGLQAAPSRAVTAELTWSQRVDLAETLIGLTGNTEWINEWDAIDKQAYDLRIERNDVIHAEWRYAGQQEEHESIRIKARGRISIALSLVSTTKLKKLAGQIAKLEDRLSRFTYTVTVGGAEQIIASPNPPGPPPVLSQTRKVRARVRVPGHVSKTEVKQLRRLRAAAEKKRRTRQKPS